MDEKMEIAIVQHDIVAESVERTLSGIESLLAGVEAVDLVVLPEMFATGFDVDDASVAEPASGGAVLRWMQSLAAARRSAVEGSVAVDDNGLRNRHYLSRRHIPLLRQASSFQFRRREPSLPARRKPLCGGI